MDKRDEILIIDDDEGTRKTLTLILKKKGFDVVSAGTGQGGLELAKGRRIAIALLDINLPDIEGIRLIAPLKEMHPGLTVIMITGFASMENAMRALNEGATGYVLKPVKIEEILVKIRDAFERQLLIKNKQLAEEALRVSEEKYRNLVENINDVIYSLDGRGVITYVSPAVEKITGYPPSQITAHPFTSFIIKDDLPGVVQTFEEGKKGKITSFQFRIVTKSGDQRWLNSSSYPAFRNGEFSGIQGVLSDITERKQAEKALQKSEEKLRIVADYTYDWEYWIAPDGTYVYMSPSCERITGYPPGEFYKKPSLFDEIVHPEDKAVYLEHMDLSFVSTLPESVEYRIVRKDEGIRWISHICQPMYGDDGKLVGRRSSNRDVTERHLAEIALRESEEKFRAFFATSMDCVFITTLDGKWVDFNDAAITLLGYDSREELLNVAIRDLYADPASRDAHTSYIRERGHSLEFPVNLRKKDGMVINTLITSVARKDSDGDLIGFQGTIRDITEKKIAQERIEELLLLQEEQLRIINTSPAVAFLWRAEENWPVEMVSQNISQFGYSVDDLISGSVLFSSVIHPDDLGRVGAEVEHNSAHNIDEFTQVYRILGKDGSEYWIDAYIHIRRDKTGKITHYEGIVLDITERKRAEDALKKSEDRYRGLVETTSDWVWEVDENGAYTYVSPQVRDLIGYTPGEVQGKTPFDFMPHDEAARVGEIIGTIVASRKAFSALENTNLHKDGRIVIIETSGVPVFRQNGQFSGYRGIDRDITERKRAEEALRKSEHRSAMLLSAIPDMMFVISRDGVYHDFSVSDKTVLAIPADQIIGKNIRDTGFKKESTDAILQHIAQAIDINALQKFEYELIVPQGVRQYEARLVALSGDEVLGIVRDITERRQAEELRKHFTEELEQQVRSRTQELETSLSEKVVLLREVHHRVKNNLQIIISLVNLQMRQTDNTEVKQIMSETRNRVRAMSLVHEKLYQSESLSRIDFADYTRFLATQLLSFFGTDARRVRLDFVLEKIMMDINTAVPLGLLMNELISNALKHGFPNGKEGTIRISGGEEGDLITLVVRDNGIGIRAELDWKNTTSLGMRLVTSLIDQIDGTIVLDRNQGTTFTITVRRKPAIGGTE